MVDYKKRIRNVQKKLELLKLDGVIITNRQNIYYLCDYVGDAGIMLITKNRALLVTDYRFEGEIVENVKGAQFILTRKSYIEELSKNKSFVKLKNVGFESFGVSYSFYYQIKK